jgi:hypothetical protein
VKYQGSRDGVKSTLNNGLHLWEELLSEMERGRTLMRQSTQTITDIYRIYLLDRDGNIEAAESYSAKSQAEANEIAASLYITCSDVFSGYELWHGTRRIDPDRSIKSRTVDDSTNRDGPDTATLLKYQDVILDLEDKLQSAYACVGRSQKLVAAARLLRERQPVKD